MNRVALALALACVALLVAGCGGSDEPEKGTEQHQPMAPGQLKEMADKLGVPGLVRQLRSTNQSERLNVIDALSTRRGNDEASQALLAIWNDASKKYTLTDKHFALIALARMQAPQAKDVIEKAYESETAYLREAAVRAVGPLGDKSLYDIVLDAFDDPDRGVRHAASQTTRRYGIEDNLQE